MSCELVLKPAISNRQLITHNLKLITQKHVCNF